jgi:AcrR family transcriptional regulator
MSIEKLDTETRQRQIARMALELLSRNGTEGFNMAALARRVGLVPSGIYRHFKSKDEVIDAALRIVARGLLDNVSAVCLEADDAVERLRLSLVRQVRLILRNQIFPRTIFSDDFYNGHPERKQKVYEYIAEYHDSLTDIIHQGQQQGQIRSDVDPRTFAVMFVGLFRIAAEMWYLSDEKFDITKHTEKAWKIFSEALKPR